MSDRRIEIYNYNVEVSPNVVMAVQNSMDDYMKECCLELLEFMAKNEVLCYVGRDGSYRFDFNGEGYTKEQLFESFL